MRSVSPGRLEQLLRSLLPAGEQHVDVARVIALLLGGQPLPEGADGWRARLDWQRAIAEALKPLPGWRYVPGDS
ncbi:MAG: hypothetical protein ACOX2L_01475 [Anaerolineae bacterium]